MPLTSAHHLHAGEHEPWVKYLSESLRDVLDDELVAGNHIAYVAGIGPNQLNNPNSAELLANGKVIGAIKKQFGDRADAQLAKKIAEELLAQ